MARAFSEYFTSDNRPSLFYSRKPKQKYCKLHLKMVQREYDSLFLKDKLPPHCQKPIKANPSPRKRKSIRNKNI
jgi:hypothetical protein